MGVYLTTGTRGRVHLVPDVASDTVALIAATQTLTNKTITSPTITSPTITGSVSSAGGLSVGSFHSTTAGSGVALGTATKALDILADDGGVALTAGSYQAARNRTLIPTAITTGDISIGGTTGQVKVVANVASSGYVAGVRGYVEVSGASITTCAGLRGMVDVPSGATIASGHIAAGIQLDSNDLGGTHTGKAAAIHVPNPVAGTWDFLAVVGTATGCHVATPGTYSTADGYLLIRVGADTMRIPYFASTD